jgi:hypothetical protein
MLKIVIGLVLLGHGMGHSMGLMGLLNVAKPNPDWNGESWLLTGTAGATVTEIVGAVLWITALVGFTALAGVVVGWLPVAWLQPLAIGASAASLAGLALFPLAFPIFSSIGAFVVNVAVLVAVVWYHWVPSDVAG